MIDRFGNIYNINVVVEQETTPKKDNMVQVTRPNSNNLYFGSPTNHMPKIKTDRPLFVYWSCINIYTSRRTMEYNTKRKLQS